MLSFDPKNSVVPDRPFTILPDIALRARRMLTSRTSEQILQAQDVLDWAVHDYFSSWRHAEILRLEADYAKGKNIDRFESLFELVDVPDIGSEWMFNENMEELKIPTEENTDYVDAIKKCFDLWDDMGGEGFPCAKPYEIFAVVALSFLALAVEYSSNPEKIMNVPTVTNTSVGFETFFDPTRIGLAGNYALMAMKAVSYADHIFQMDRSASSHSKDIEQLHSEYKKIGAIYLENEAINQKEKFESQVKKSMRSQALNIARHRKTKQARQLVFAEWDKDRTRFPSAERAATHFASSLEGPDFEYATRTISDWIRAYAKEQGVSFR